MELLKAYKRVFLRKEVEYFDMDTYLFRPQEVMDKFSEGKTLNSVIGIIKRVKDKEYRNFRKREDLPIFEMYCGGFLSVDIDDILGNEVKINRIVRILSANEYCFAVKETPSKNLVAFFKVDCTREDFPKVYYKLYLELTLVLGIKIDYLPEPERLRYISNGEVHYYNEDSKVLTEFLDEIELPKLFKMEEEEEVTKTKKGKKIKRTKRMYIAGSYEH